jgi:hypothetical protein
MSRMTQSPAPERPTLEELIERAKKHKMTPAERYAQRRSWVRGNLLIDNEGADEANLIAILDEMVPPIEVLAAKEIAEAYERGVEDGRRQAAEGDADAAP